MFGCELDYKESWAPKNWCFWTVVLEKTLESPLDCKEIQPVHPKGDQSWIFIGRTDAEAEIPILWPPDAKNWLIGKDLNSWSDWRQEEKGMTKNEMVGWQHRLDGHEFEQDLGVGDGQESLACCSLWGCRELDMTEWLNWTDQVFPTTMPAVKASSGRSHTSLAMFSPEVTHITSAQDSLAKTNHRLTPPHGPRKYHSHFLVSKREKSDIFGQWHKRNSNHSTWKDSFSVNIYKDKTLTEIS